MRAARRCSTTNDGAPCCQADSLSALLGYREHDDVLSPLFRNQRATPPQLLQGSKFPLPSLLPEKKSGLVSFPSLLCHNR